jgi:hypothetical protein
MSTGKPWIRLQDQLPPDKALVETKIDDERGCRNEQQLQLHNNLWWHPDMSMYVYYTPTHWRNV